MVVAGWVSNCGVPFGVRWWVGEASSTELLGREDADRWLAHTGFSGRMNGSAGGAGAAGTGGSAFRCVERRIGKEITLRAASEIDRRR